MYCVKPMGQHGLILTHITYLTYVGYIVIYVTYYAQLD